MVLYRAMCASRCESGACRACRRRGAPPRATHARSMHAEPRHARHHAAPPACRVCGTLSWSLCRWPVIHSERTPRVSLTAGRFKHLKIHSKLNAMLVCGAGGSDTARCAIRRHDFEPAARAAQHRKQRARAEARCGRQQRGRPGGCGGRVRRLQPRYADRCELGGVRRRPACCPPCPCAGVLQCPCATAGMRSVGCGPRA